MSCIRPPPPPPFFSGDPLFSIGDLLLSIGNPLFSIGDPPLPIGDLSDGKNGLRLNIKKSNETKEASDELERGLR